MLNEFSHQIDNNENFLEKKNRFQHPGGNEVILDYGGRDASIAFRGHSQYALKSLKTYEIGELPEKERIYRKPGLLKCDELPE